MMNDEFTIISNNDHFLKRFSYRILVSDLKCNPSFLSKLSND